MTGLARAGGATRPWTQAVGASEEPITRKVSVSQGGHDSPSLAPSVLMRSWRSEAREPAAGAAEPRNRAVDTYWSVPQARPGNVLR